MTTAYSTNLGLALPVQGELSGTWGDTVNKGITDYLDISVAGTLTLTGDGAVTLANTNGNATSNNITGTTAQYAVLRITGTLTTTKIITAPSSSKTYTVLNAATGGSVTVKAAGQTGVTLSVGESASIAFNGTDYVRVAGDVVGPASATTNALAAFDGTTGKLIKNASLTANNVLLGNGTGAPLTVAPGTSGNVLTSNGTTWTSATVPAGGLTYLYRTTSYTASDKQGVLADTTGGAFTVTLPATPATGAQVVVADAGSFWGTNNLTVGRNGSTIGGLAENLVCDITGASVQLVYDGTTWEVYAQIGGNGGNAVTLAGIQTLTNKTIAFASNTLTGVAPLASPTFTGTPAAPTAAAATNTTQVATTAFVFAERSNTATLTNKTLTSPVLDTATASGLTLNDGYTEEIFAVTGTTPALSPTNGSIQTWTLSGNSTPTQGTWANGQSLTLMIDDGTAFTINWTSLAVTWKTNGGVAPTLNLTGFTVIQLWEVGNVIYGARVGDA